MDDEYDYYDEDIDEDIMSQSNPSYFLPVMEASVLHAHSTNFTLLMEHPVLGHSEYRTGQRIGVDHSIHPRYDQPCLGELRKYKATHPDECTQPGNEKPTDLWHPFPDGNPVMVGTKFVGATKGPYHVDIDLMIEEAFSDESPWALGGSPKFVRGESYLVGVVLQDTAVDPTTMVNLFNNIRCRTGVGVAYKTLRDEGLSIREAFAVLLFSGRGTPFNYIYGPDGYYTTSRVSARRILEAKPRDLSGGLFCDRIDYNRTELENVFMLDQKPTKDFRQELIKLGLSSNPDNFYWKSGASDKDKCKALRDAILAVAESEAPQKDTMFNIETQTCDLIDVEVKEAA